MADLFEQYDIPALQAGISEDPQTGNCTCIECGRLFEAGEVYPAEGRFLGAKKAAIHHCRQAHGNRLDTLLSSHTAPLTDHQKKLLRLIAAGHSDAEIADETGATRATVRRQRFSFREKAKQAKAYLAIYGLAMQGRLAPQEELIAPPTGATGLDDRFVLTRAESDQYIKNAFESTSPLRLRRLPVKEKKKVAVLNLIAGQFQKGTDYTEAQVNGILKPIHPDDYVTLRRYLVEYGYLQRVPGGRRYWVP